MIRKHDANDIARSRLSEMEPDTGLELVVTEVREFAFGWVFFYTSKRYLETGNISYALAGNAPFVVRRDSGDVHDFGTAYPFEHYLNEYVKDQGSH
jgi:hypothetical protein